MHNINVLSVIPTEVRLMQETKESEKKQPKKLQLKVPDGFQLQLLSFQLHLHGTSLVLLIVSGIVTHFPFTVGTVASDTFVPEPAQTLMRFPL